MTLYPLLFNEIFKDKIWGGNKLKTLLGKTNASDACGESWEISGVADNLSVVSNGELAGKNIKEIIQTYKEELVGKKVFEAFGDEFPLLIKFLDAKEDLSIQVHPNDRIAKQKHNGFGKSEMWYVVQADLGATLISGFEREIAKDAFKAAVLENKLEGIIKINPAQKGDVFNIPAGRIHTIGKGLVIAEIQQTSDITYRIYDFDRADSQGNKRELHLDDALEALDFEVLTTAKTDYTPIKDKAVKTVDSPYFETNFILLETQLERNLAQVDSFKIYMVTEGTCELTTPAGTTVLTLGQTCLIPACINQYTLTTQTGAKLLEVYLP